MSDTELTHSRTSADIEVRTRTEVDSSDEAVYLCHAPFQTLEELVTLIRRWGIAVDGNTYVHASGQYVIANWGAGFEIIVDTAEAAS